MSDADRLACWTNDVKPCFITAIGSISMERLDCEMTAVDVLREARETYELSRVSGASASSMKVPPQVMTWDKFSRTVLRAKHPPRGRRDVCYRRRSRQQL
jgi:hypothetical protein